MFNNQCSILKFEEISNFEIRISKFYDTNPKKAINHSPGGATYP
jgi:hypothetical protein